MRCGRSRRQLRPAGVDDGRSLSDGGLAVDERVLDDVDDGGGELGGVAEALGEGDRLGQGRENSKTFLKENPKIAQEIESAVRESAGLIEKKMLVEPTDEDKADNAITEDQVEAIAAPAVSVNEPLEKPVKARKRG